MVGSGELKIVLYILVREASFRLHKLGEGGLLLDFGAVLQSYLVVIENGCVGFFTNNLYSICCVFIGRIYS